MLRITSELDERELVRALHELGRDRVRRFIRQLLLFKDDQVLLEETADMILEELERRATSPS